MKLSNSFASQRTIPTTKRRFGSFFYKDGGVYTGDYKNNLFHGTGTISYADGDKYVGEWANGTYHGKGIYTFSNGKIQKGKFVKGKFTG